MENKAKLITGDIKKHLIEMTLPMIFGLLGVMLFNLTDTYFIGKLGPKQLAALSYTFPVVMIIQSLAVGLGLGTAALASRLIGENRKKDAAILSTHSLLLGLTVVLILLIIMFLNTSRVFSLLGAEDIVLEYIKEYMYVWYFGMFFVVIPMIGNSVLRSLGDAKTAGILMVISASINIILDPLLIFGIWFFPELGIRGGALATVFSRALTSMISLYILYKREKMINFSEMHIKTIINSWGKILYIGLPNALINMITPIGAGIVTRILSSYGETVVAGFGVASKIEMIAFAITGALASVMGPFVGQNLGARAFDRVNYSNKLSKMFSLSFGVFIALVLFILARPIAGLFTESETVIRTTVIYLRIVPVAYGFQGILKIGATILNVLNQPFRSSFLTLSQTFIFYIPMALVLKNFFDIRGIFMALAISYIFTGIISHFFVNHRLIKVEEKLATVKCQES
ncbi:MAG TPA: MATE family efflux transporter [Clostridia bacterium]|nr:MATE family efflux transporter [Clostridia bacterium]